MTKIFKRVAFAAALAASTVASGATLTFDGLNTVYGDGNPLGANMTGDGQYLQYQEAGFLLTLNTTNDPMAAFGAHIGDGTGVADTFNWHDDGDNLIGAYVTLTKVGGGAFSLSSFDWQSDGLTVSANGYMSAFLSGSQVGQSLGFNNVTSVTFSSANYTSNGLDNVVLSAAAVPEPASWALLMVGFGLTGAALRRRSAMVAA